MLNDIITPKLAADGYKIICGVDEAGRGPLAGPVCAAAVAFAPDTVIEGLDDSKKLTEKRREALFNVIREKALAVGVALIDSETIDRVNILNATMAAMVNAVDKLTANPDIILIDGNKIPPPIERGGVPSRAIIGGDALTASIAAASVIAKVTRDRLMLEMDALYPVYGFAKHKGYGTAAHYEAIKLYGLCPIHRRTFTKGYDTNA